MMCADCLHLASVLDIFQRNNVEYLHIDVMDGHFVPNYTLGTDYCRALKKASDIPLDIHLMVEEPENKIPWFPIGKDDLVSVHAESTRHLQRALALIRQMGGKPLVALNPATPLVMIENVLDDIDGVLIMTVNPGYAGQKLVESTLVKIRQLRNYLDKNGYTNVEIEVDGNVSFENTVRMKDAGANIYVTGSSGIFRHDLTLEEGIGKMREII